jgi:hypothetical protein
MSYPSFSDWIGFMDSVELTACASKAIDEKLAEGVEPCDVAEIAALADRSSVGKRLLGAFYVHISALPALDPILQNYERLARSYLQQPISPTLIKFNTNQPKISYLFYPEFDTDPHPALQRSFPSGSQDRGSGRSRLSKR